ncbi:MAG: hypothetical protein GVY16_09655 [Planctomycetes bacterium]|jgi:hypothetical protein|nr:hypothetical protein [Phycisphaerae bacterium]NBB95986.1 hypothetical protein [Planctomycetota bacterium]
MLRDELFEAISELPVIDVHSHINRDHMQATGLDQVMFYHMQMYPSRAAGTPEDRMWPEQRNIAAGLPYEEFLRAWPKTKHSGFGWMLRTILRDLYGFEKELTVETLPELREVVDARRTDADWPKQVFEKCNLSRLCSSVLDVAPLEPDAWQPPISFTVEDAPSSGKQDFLNWKRRLAEIGRLIGRVCANVDDLREATATFYDRYDRHIADGGVVVSWLGGEADLTPASDATVNRAIAEVRDGGDETPERRRLLEAAYTRAICDAIRGRARVFQFCYGTQYVTRSPLHSHPIAKAAPQFAQTFPYLLGEYPDLHFNLLNGFEPDEPVWSAMVQGYGNISLANFWWQCFYPTVMHRGWARRLDMVPLSRLIGFFSDGWCVDYVYGRLTMVRRTLANVLAERIERGYADRQDALEVARTILFDTPHEIFLPDADI